MRNPIPYRVECRYAMRAGFEQIAGFNVECVARRYAVECQRANNHNQYRVTYRGKVISS